MNEKDIRDRIGRFLKKTARTVVVPASMGLGLSTGCDGHGLHKAGDARLDSGASHADTLTAGLDLAEDAVKNDVPMMMVPYVVAMDLDAAVRIDVSPDGSTAQAADADHDVLPDLRADISYPPPPYLAPPPPPIPDAATDTGREAARGDAAKDAPPDLRADIAFPPPPYLMPPLLPDELMGGATPDKK